MIKALKKVGGFLAALLVGCTFCLTAAAEEVSGGAEPVVYAGEEHIDENELAAVISAQSFNAAAQTTSKDFFIKCAGSRWGYNEAAQRSNGKRRQQFYDRLLDKMIIIWNRKTDLPTGKAEDKYNYEMLYVPYSDLGLTRDEARETYNSFLYDNPVFYFLAKKYGTTRVDHQDGTVDYGVMLYTCKEYLSASARADCQSAIERYVKQAASVYKTNDSAYNNVLRLHDKILDTLTYNSVSGTALYTDYYYSAHNIMGGVKYGKGVCESYAKLFHLISSYCGLDCVYVIGKGTDSSGKSGNHVWNLVKLDDGYYYCFDSTWDDEQDKRRFFAKGTDTFDSSHAAQSSGWNSEKQFFYGLPYNIACYSYDVSKQLARNHTHSFKNWTLMKKPTCTEDGSEQRMCSVCNYTQTRTVCAKGHTFTNKKSTPNCNTPDAVAHVCSVCGFKYTELLSTAKGHQFAVTKTVDATCTEDGYTLSVCKVCGESKKTDIVKAAGHSFVTETIPATCTAEGCTQKRCTVCGAAVKLSTEKATGHNYSSMTVKPTCTQAGYTLHVCLSCGDVYFEQVKAPEGHKLKRKSAKAATCTEDGVEHFICTVCGISSQRTIKAAGHSFNSVTVAPKNGKPGYTEHTCTVCGESCRDAFIPAPGDYELTSTKAASCETEGEEVYTCEETGDSYTVKIPAAGHRFRDVVHAPDCENAGYTEHICEVCGKKYTDREIPANGHSFVNKMSASTATAGGYTEHTCVICGKKVTDSYDAPLGGFKLGTVRAALPAKDYTAFKAVVYSAKGTKLFEAKADGNGVVYYTEKPADGSYMTDLILPGCAKRRCYFEIKDGVSNLGDMLLCARGDLDGSGKIDVDDLVIMQRLAAGWKAAAVYPETADTDGNGKFELGDLTLMQKYLSGWKVEFK